MASTTAAAMSETPNTMSPWKPNKVPCKSSEYPRASSTGVSKALVVENTTLRNDPIIRAIPAAKSITVKTRILFSIFLIAENFISVTHPASPV